jgi:hypothetical protein
MRVRLLATFLLVCVVPIEHAAAQRGAPRDTALTDIKTMVARLDLDKYKATIKGLTQFGDRRQGTDRNRAAEDWIEAQLKSYGCTNTERIKYEYNGRQLKNDSTNKVDSLRNAANPAGARGGRGRGGAAGGGDDTASAGGRGGRGARGAGGRGRGGNPVKGFTARTGVNTNPALQPDTALRRINAQWDTPGAREEVYCTKIGTTHPEEMYIVGGHMDGHGFGYGARDGAGAHFQFARRANRAFRQVHSFQQRRDGRRRSGVCAPAVSAAGHREPAGFGEVSRAKMARHDSA